MAGEGLYRVVITQLMYSQQIQNVLNFVGPAADSGALLTLANDVNTIWIENLRHIQQGDIKYVNINVRALDTVLSPFDLTINKSGSGNLTPDLDPTMCVVMRLRTLHAGKHGRGRVYVSGFHHNVFEQGVITPNFVQQVATFRNQVLGNTGFDSSPFKLQVMTPKPPYIAFGVTDIQPAPTAGHQTRRTIGRGI